MSDVRLLGPLALREFTLARACEESVGHTHNYDHVTFVQEGGVRVEYRLPEERKERVQTFKAGDLFLVEKDVSHTIRSLMPTEDKAAAVRRVKALMVELGVESWELDPLARYACSFMHRDHDGLVIQEYTGNMSAYE